MKGFNLSEWALNHRSFTIYLMIASVAAGVWCYLTLGRDEDPSFTIKTMVVEALWPGATTQETLDQVTDRLEKKLEETPSLDYLQSYTSPGQSVIFVTLKDSTPPSDVADIWYQVRKKTGDIQSALPEGVRGPFFNDEFGDTFGIIYAFTGEGFNYREIKDYAESVRAEMLRLPDIGKVEMIGVQDEKIYIEFSTQKLASLGISLSDVMQSLKAQNAVLPSGSIETEHERILVRVSGGFTSEDDLKAINLRANGRFFRLSDIASIHRGFSDPPAASFRFNGQPAIGLAISMAKGGDVLRLGENVRHRMAELQADRPIGIDVSVVADQPSVVQSSVHTFIESLQEAVLIVLVVSFLSLGLRAGLVVAFSIPLVLTLTFAGMSLMDISLQRVSLGALIIALGLLVDDAMITVEMMVRKREEGVPVFKAATFAYTSTAFPMLTGTLVTMAGFVPVGFAPSASGEYCFSLFAVVCMALAISWIVAVMFAPLIGTALLAKSIKSKENSQLSSRLNGIFRRALVVCMNHRWITIIVTVGLFSLSVYGSQFLQNQFFPPSERPELLVNITLPQGSSMAATQAAVEKLEKRLAADGDVGSFSVYVGSGAIRFYLPLDVQLDHDYFAQAVVISKSVEVRNTLAARLQKVLEADQPDAIIRVSPLELGPPVGWPLKYRVNGPDVEKVRMLAYRVADVMASDPATRSINFDWNEPIKTIRLEVLQDKARLLGLSTEALEQLLYTHVHR